MKIHMYFIIMNYDDIWIKYVHRNHVSDFYFGKKKKHTPTGSETAVLTLAARLVYVPRDERWSIWPRFVDFSLSNYYSERVNGLLRCLECVCVGQQALTRVFQGLSDSFGLSSDTLDYFTFHAFILLFL